MQLHYYQSTRKNIVQHSQFPAVPIYWPTFPCLDGGDPSMPDGDKVRIQKEFDDLFYKRDLDSKTK